MKKEFSKILKFLHEAEKLKFELRHSWESSGRQESVAEHTWRVSLMVILFAPYLCKKINMEKALKLAVIHDLVEAFFQDIPTFQTHRKKEKEENELKAIETIKKLLKNQTGREIYNLWLDYEYSKSYEAKYVKALDKMECRIQHNEANISTWKKIEFPRSLFAADKYCEFNQSTKLFNQIVKKESRQKISKEAKLDLKGIEKQARKLKK